MTIWTPLIRSNFNDNGKYVERQHQQKIVENRAERMSFKGIGKKMTESVKYENLRLHLNFPFAYISAKCKIIFIIELSNCW